MAFYSKYAPRIWDKLYNVIIPDRLTINPNYARTRGVFLTKDKNIDYMVSNNTIPVMIPVAKILEYYTNGIQVEIPSREDMITIHKDIDLYLSEWKDHIYKDINLDVAKHKELLSSLDRLSKDIYNRASPSEVVSNIATKYKLGLVSTTERVNQSKPENKPDYKSISSMINSNKPKSRY